MAPARPPLDAVPLIIQPTRSRAAAEKDLYAPLVGPHNAIQARRSSRVLQACAWAGRAEHTFLGPRPLCSDVNNVNGPEVKLICHAGPQ